MFTLKLKSRRSTALAGAFTESAAYCYSKLTGEKKAEFLNAYFTEEGLNYNLGRTHINSCDFSLGNYAAVEVRKTKILKVLHGKRRKIYFPSYNDACKIKTEGFVSSFLPGALQPT